MKKIKLNARKILGRSTSDLKVGCLKIGTGKVGEAKPTEEVAAK